MQSQIICRVYKNQGLDMCDFADATRMYAGIESRLIDRINSVSVDATRMYAGIERILLHFAFIGFIDATRMYAGIESHVLNELV